jgi:ribonuclease BN (tRNA processing enzyme)
MDRETFICACHSLEHQYSFWYDEEDNEVYFEPHLFLSGNWFQRLGQRLRYLFGYKSRYGAFDDVIIKPEDAEKMIKYLEKLTDKDIDKVVDRGRD